MIWNSFHNTLGISRNLYQALKSRLHEGAVHVGALTGLNIPDGVQIVSKHQGRVPIAEKNQEKVQTGQKNSEFMSTNLTILTS